MEQSKEETVRNLDYARLKADKEYREQVNELLNHQYVTYAKFSSSMSYGSRLQMSSPDGGYLTTIFGGLSRFWFNPKSNKIEQRVIKPEGGMQDGVAVSALTFVGGLNQYLLFEEFFNKKTRGLSLLKGRTLSLSEIHLRKELVYYCNDSSPKIVAPRDSGVKDMIYFNYDSSSVAIFSAKNKKILRNVKSLNFVDPFKKCKERPIFGIKCLHSRNLVILMHMCGSLKLLDPAFNIIQRLGPIKIDFDEGEIHSFDVCEEVPGEKSSPLLLFVRAGNRRNRKKAYFGKIVVKENSQFEAVLDGEIYKKRFIFHEKDSPGLSGPSENLAEIKNLKSKLEKSIRRKIGDDSVLLKGMYNLINSRFKGPNLYEPSSYGPFKLDILDQISINEPSGEHYDKITSTKFSGFLEPQSSKYPVFIGNEDGRLKGILLFVINEQNQIICPHPSVKSLIKTNDYDYCSELVSSSSSGGPGSGSRKVFYSMDGSSVMRRFEIKEGTRKELLRRVRDGTVEDFEEFSHL